jgi:hypothetical protein
MIGVRIPNFDVSIAKQFGFKRLACFRSRLESITINRATTLLVVLKIDVERNLSLSAQTSLLFLGSSCSSSNSTHDDAHHRNAAFVVA